MRMKGRRDPRGVERIDVASGEHLRQGLGGADPGELEFRGQVELEFFVAAGLFLASGAVLDTRRVDSVLVLQDAADPYRSSHLVFRGAYAFADEILRLTDAAFRGNENARLPKKTRGEHRNGDEWRVVARRRYRVRRQGHFRHVEFSMAEHAEERFLDMQIEVIELDAVHRNTSVGERTGAVVVPASQGQTQFVHGVPTNSIKAVGPSPLSDRRGAPCPQDPGSCPATAARPGRG